MNSTNNRTVLYMSKEQWIIYFGGSSMVDSIKVYLFTPLALLGVLLNLVCFFVFISKEFRNQPLYSYFRIFTLNSTLIEALQATVFLVKTYEFFDFSNTYASFFYFSFLYRPILSTAYFYGNVLDVLITLERICQLNKKFTILKKASPLLLCFFSLVFCIIINIPSFMINNVSYIDLKTSPTESFRLFYFSYSTFARSFLGKILTYVVYVIRDGFTLIAQVVLGIILIILVKRYANRRKRLFNLGYNSTPDQSSMNSDKAKVSTNPMVKKTDSKIDRKVTLMVIFICTLSSVEHLFVLVSAVYFYYIVNSIGIMLSLVSDFFIILKSLSNFFFFFFFNKIFRDKLKSLLKI